MTNVYAERLHPAIHTYVKASSCINRFRQTVNDQRSLMQINY